MIGYRKIPYHLVSLGLHGLLIAIAFLFSKNFSQSDLTTVDGSKIRVIGQAIRVDVVSMPKMTIQELKNYEEAPGNEAQDQPLVEERKDVGGDENVVFQKEENKPSFQDMLKNLSTRKTTKAEVVKNEPVKDAGAGGIRGDKLKKILSLGNQISEGSSLYGSGGENSGDIFDLYTISITQEVRKYWSLPGFLANKNLSCRIQIFISAEGKLLKANIYQSSGNPDYDQRALSAVNRVTRFAKPDKSIVPLVSTGQIALGFPL